MDIENFLKNAMQAAGDEAHEHFAQGLAKTAREEGLTSADSIKLTTESDSKEFTIDAERVRRRANEILRESDAPSK
jgi:hypothetical protein